jgi:hypothetical protein
MRGQELCLGTGGIKLGEHRGTRHETQPLQENALWQRSMRPRASGPRSGGEGRKIHMRGDIHLTGRTERINRLARAHGLEAIAESAFCWAVIYD